MPLTYNQLKTAMQGPSAGIRCRTRLEPLGGATDKVFPPTYGVAKGAETKYALEDRKIGGEVKKAVVLDSVAAQSNRQELALLDLKRAGAPIPVVAVDFSGTPVADLDVITSLEASHRVFDALFRDSLNGEILFRLSEPGHAATEATPKNCAALLALAPTALLFGAWDSTGPKGGLGSKYERAITSEIVATGVTLGSKTASRLDVLEIEKAAGLLYKAEDASQTWTTDPELAEKEKGKPVQVGSGTDSGRPSQINHGNIVPSIDTTAGGITAEEITSTTVLSFAQLRRLLFPLDSNGTELDGEDRAAAETAARCAIAALGLLGVVGSLDGGIDLRSRCVLVATEDQTFELIGRNTSDISTFTLTSSEALELLEAAVADLRAHGLQWNDEDLTLTPSPKLVELIVRSRDHSATKSVEAEDDE